MSGRPNCAMCNGDGFVRTDHISKTSAVTDDGRLITACPACTASDQMLYGAAYVKDGVRIKPPNAPEGFGT